MSPRWTPQQEDAIQLRGHNLLVSAAAGSGKTAVLVERIVRRIMDPSDPLEIDRLLVVTFTEAAAGEMRERIGVRLERALEEDPDNTRLRRQSALLARASISTLHAFCLRVIRQNFHRLDLDPALRTLSEHEARLLRQETLEQLFEEQCAARHTPFFDLVESYGGRHDEGVQELVLRAHALAYSQPWPEVWFERCVSPFELGLDDPLPACWTAPVRLAAGRAVQRGLDAIDAALDLCRRPAGPLAWVSILEEDRVQLLQLLTVVEQFRWDDIGLALTEWLAAKAKQLRKVPEADEAIMERVRELRNGIIKPAVKSLADGILSRPERELVSEVCLLGPVARELIRLVQEFDTALSTIKTERGVIDFGDMERLALRLLMDPSSPPGSLLPSEIALGLRRRFEEVLIDEYQDINETQDAILQLVSRDGTEGAPNRFMVGDVKQSIYRFRLAEPRLFLEKYRGFQPARGSEGMETDAANARVDLNANFRSRRSVVDAVNFVFRQVMTRSVGELDYDASAELAFGADYPPYPEGHLTELPVELHLLDRGDEAQEADPGSFEDSPSEEADASGIELEAAVIGDRVRALVQGTECTPPLQVWDRELGAYRDARYRDVVVLLRAASTQAPAMVDVLRRMGVPVYARATTGYLASLEVHLVLSLLQVIDNPRQDLPLATVLRSSLVGLNDVELARTRRAAPEGDFYTAVVEMAGSTTTATAMRLREFLSDLERWRRQIHRGPLSHFIEDLYDETGLPTFALAMPGGDQRSANLRALVERAGEFDHFARQGLFRFLRHIERLRDAGEDLGTAPAMGEGEDVVRLMTIHQSKGLEFPVVVLANLGGRFRNDSGDVLLDRELGVGPQVVDLRLRLKHPSLAHHALRERGRAQCLAEEMRLLYVALTRARELLVLTGSVKSLPAQAGRWLTTSPAGPTALPDALLADARCYLDWLGPSLARHPSAGSQLAAACECGPLPPSPFDDDPSQWKVRCWRSSETSALLPKSRENEDPCWALISRGEPLDRPVTEELYEQLTPNSQPIYQFLELAAAPGKRTVSEIKRLFEPDHQAAALPSSGVPLRLPQPRFDAFDSAAIAKSRGVATHSLLEHVELDGPCDEPGLQAQLSRLVRMGVLLRAEAGTVHVPSVRWFLGSPLGCRLRAAGTSVQREWMFTVALPVTEVDPDLVDTTHSEETVVVQGVIDCLFRDAEGVVLIDYKTDRLGDEDRAHLAERHRMQLHLYSLAVHAVYGLPVKEAYVVYLRESHMQRVI